MIFCNPTLMPTPETALLFMVHNPVPLQNYEDHQAALCIQLHELVIRSRAEGENPIALVEDYLGVYYNEGATPEEITSFLINQDVMIRAFSILRSNWKSFNPNVKSESITERGLSKEEYMERYAEITLRTYLETLSNVFNTL